MKNDNHDPPSPPPAALDRRREVLHFQASLISGQRNANLYKIACKAARDEWNEGALRGELWNVL
ncbi:MAG: hypothetical protein LBN29_12885 [Mediterranea sp.]|jgi:hypothetical protein|nr:hypothetical protein [Mediterranea sp.]